MNLHEVAPKRMSSAAPPGWCSLAKSAVATFSRMDLVQQRILIGQAATVEVALLAEDDLKIIGIRPPSDEDEHPHRTLTMSKTGTTGWINVINALTDLSLKPEDVAGKYQVMLKGNMILVTLSTETAKRGGRPRKAAKDGQ